VDSVVELGDVEIRWAAGSRVERILTQDEGRPSSRATLLAVVADKDVALVANAMDRDTIHGTFDFPAE